MVKQPTIAAYTLWNNLLGWACFLIAAVTYLLTVEPTASFWDCPEFIAQGMKLEVGHPPGNPIFMLAARFFVNFAGGDVTRAALMVNSMSALLSAATILLLFWTITHLVRRLMVADGQAPTLGQCALIFGAGLCGGLMYAWSDTFWFSAVEGEVYAFSSFCTALVFWLILKWESRADQPHSDRYLILIAYIIGVSIAVHLLNLLCIPAIVLVIYYRKFKDTTATGSLASLCIAAAIVALILYGLVPGFIEIAGDFELFFVNTLGCSYNVGVAVYALIFVAVMIWSVSALYRQRSTNEVRWSFLLGVVLSGIPFIGSSMWIPVVLTAALAVYLWCAKLLPVRILTVALLSILVIFVGYSSYALLLIRSHANPPMNQNAPDNVFSLSSYLSREQYGETPLLFGPSFKSTVVYELSPSRNDYSPSRKAAKTVVEKAVKTSPDQPDRYVEHEGMASYNMTPNMLFPRMYSAAGGHPQAYMDWAGINENDLQKVDAPVLVDTDGSTVQTAPVPRPSFAQNMRYFFTYQLNHMYWRYFMWNFAGRQNDIQGNGEPNRGNWVSGIPFVDNPRLGDQSLLPDDYGRGNKGHNVFYLLPLVMGLIGLSWQAFCSKRGIEQFWVIFFFFFMTGVAIVLYLNQPPSQPRERDYAFAGSFYAFAIWVGMGVPALWAALKWLGRYLRLKSERELRPYHIGCVALAVLVGLFVPVQVVSQTWDDHDRSGRFTTRDYGMNYLSSLDPDAIIYTNGDNDTFPLWYVQEVEGYRTDVRVVNLSYLTTDWYANQMKIPTDGARAIDFSAQPADYAADRLQYNYFDPENMSEQRVNAFTSLDDLYHNSKAEWKGSRIMRYPSMYIPSNVDAAVKAGVISPEQAPQADEAILIDLYKDPSNPGGGATLSQALTLDMMATQIRDGWNRPTYFAMTVPDEYYVSTGPYLRNTGMAFQLTPLRSDDGSREPGINTDKMYRNVTERFRWGNLDTLAQKGGDVYLDETVRRMVTTHRSALSDLAYALYVEGHAAAHPQRDSLTGVTPEANPAFARDRFAKSAEILDLIGEKLPLRYSPYSIQIGYRIADNYLLLADELDDEALRKKGMDILEGELTRYAAYLPYYMELRRSGRFGSLSYADRYVPTYIYVLLQAYADEGGDVEALQKQLDAQGIDLNDLGYFLK